MHADGEYVVWQSVEELARIQIEYLKKSGECLKREKYRAAAGQETEAKPVFAADGGGSCGREEISCVSGEGLAFAEASFDLSEFATVRLSGLQVQKLQLLPNFAG